MSNKQQLNDEFCKHKVLYNTKPCLVVPVSMINNIVGNHNTIFYGHQGIKHTLNLINYRYYCSTMNKDIEAYISKCVSCNQRK